MKKREVPQSGVEKNDGFGTSKLLYGSQTLREFNICSS